MDIADLDELDDDFTFEPSGWDLAMSIGLGVQPESDRDALDELADATLVWADEDVLAPLIGEAARRLWDSDLEASVREGLAQLADKPDWSAAAAVAVEDLDARAGRAEVAREVVCHLAMQLGQADQPFCACLCCIDEELERLEPHARRASARRAALLARRNAAVPDDELQAAMAQVGAVDPVVALGTRERREAVRRRLARLGRLGSASMPALAAELTRIGAERLPPVEEDDVWRELCTWMLAEAAALERN
jgi:hypothetical protein